MSIPRQDRNGVRTATDLQRRYKFGDIELTEKEVEELRKLIKTDSKLSLTSINPVQNKVVTEALNRKVNTEEGKGLSSNDFSDELKEKLDNIMVVTVLDTLESESTTDALSAKQGKVLDEGKLNAADCLTNTEIETLINNIVL